MPSDWPEYSRLADRPATLTRHFCNGQIPSPNENTLAFLPGYFLFNAGDRNNQVEFPRDPSEIHRVQANSGNIFVGLAAGIATDPDATQNDTVFHYHEAALPMGHHRIAKVGDVSAPAV